MKRLVPCVTSLNCVDQSSCSPKWSLGLSAKCKTNSHYLLVLYVQLIHSLMKLIFVQCFQPRRIVAMSIAERVAWERGEVLGKSIGYQVHYLSLMWCIELCQYFSGLAENCCVNIHFYCAFQFYR